MPSEQWSYSRVHSGGTNGSMLLFLINAGLSATNSLPSWNIINAFENKAGQNFPPSVFCHCWLAFIRMTVEQINDIMYAKRTTVPALLHGQYWRGCLYPLDLSATCVYRSILKFISSVQRYLVQIGETSLPQSAHCLIFVWDVRNLWETENS